MANESGIGLEYPIRVMGGDGTVLWQGCGFPSDIVRAQNYATTAISPGHALVYFGQLLMVPNAAATATRIQQVLKVRLSNTTGSYDRGWAGVALTNAQACAAAGDTTGGLVVIAQGGVVPVRSLASGSLTANLAGEYVISSTTDGTVNATSSLPTVPIGYLGKVVTGGIAGTTGGTTDSGSGSILIVAVSPS